MAVKLPAGAAKIAKKYPNVWAAYEQSAAHARSPGRSINARGAS
jgi:hypothetical protein